MTQYNPKELSVDKVADQVDDDITLSRSVRQSRPHDGSVTQRPEAAPMDAPDPGAKALDLVHHVVAERVGDGTFEHIAEIEHPGLAELIDHADLDVMRKNCQEFEALTDEPDMDDLES